MKIESLKLVIDDVSEQRLADLHVLVDQGDLRSPISVNLGTLTLHDAGMLELTKIENTRVIITAYNI